MIDYAPLEVWFFTGSQHLYGPETLAQVERDSRAVVDGLNASGRLPIRVVFRAVVKTPEEISAALREADATPRCIGIIAWMHTFSPAKMWIGALSRLRKPLCHLHTQFGRDIPWKSIDMDFMNLHQSAHGDREFGFIGSRLRLNRKVVVGHWQEGAAQDRVAAWMRAAAAWHDSQTLKIARIGDNMRQVAVTEGDKVEAELRFGYSVNGYGVGDLVARVNAVPDVRIDELCAEYASSYTLMPGLEGGGARHQSLRDAARIELGLRDFLQEGGFGGYTDTFENLHGLKQLPGIASQRLMADGYGFGAEGDWKIAALVRAMKVMAHGLEGGTSFMEDYTYHFDPAGRSVLGAHMLEICPSIAAGKPSCEVHPLGIGGKEDPVRLVFDSKTGPAVNATIVDMGNRFRMIVNVVDVIPPLAQMPKLPVARALWIPQPDLDVAAAAWIYAGGAHHTGFSLALTVEHLEDFANMAGVEFLLIDSETRLRDFRNELRWNDAAYGATRR
ncbi:MAG TPA: L-arabinose isomerase [Gemmatimonadaceae bacterium]|nr:L-arabinose isomerase [Gemmatimonadaceae bacterium]